MPLDSYPAERVTLDLALSSWLQSRQFLGYSNKTKKLTLGMCGYIRTHWGDWPVQDFRVSDFAFIRDENQHRATLAVNLISMLRSVFTHAMEFGVIDWNPARGVVCYRTSTPIKMWDYETFDYVQRHADPLLAVPLLWMRWTCLRVGDALSLQKHHIKGDWLEVTESKTHNTLFIPLSKPLRQDIAKRKNGLEDHDWLFVNSAGTGWFQSNLLGKLKRFLVKHNLPDYSFHGLRKLGITHLVNNGASHAEISAITGQSQRTVEYYASGYDKLKLARQAMEKIDV